MVDVSYNDPSSSLIIDVDGNTSEQIIHLMRGLPGLTPIQRGTLIMRYKRVEATIKSRAQRYGFFFHTGRFTVTVGSLLVPALISIQNTNFIQPEYVYWFAWIISLLVSICNGLISLIKVDKKYYFLYCVLEMFHTETWQYLALSGRYSDGCHGYSLATHQNQYVYFFHALERIKVKQVEEEYYKLTDMHNQNQARKKGGEDGEKKDGTVTESGSNNLAIDMDGLNIPTPALGILAENRFPSIEVDNANTANSKKESDKKSVIEKGRPILKRNFK